MLLSCLFNNINAQYHNDIKYLDVNNFKSGITLHGDMWMNPITQNAECEYPKGSGKHIGFAGSFWLTADDDAGNVYTSYQTFRSGVDFWPGPLDANGYCDSLTSYKWAKIWKVNIDDINDFRAIPNKTISNVPPDILTWPGKGNIHAAGKNNEPLTINRDMAPFVDVNNNGIYDPLNGDYPQIKGDQMLWWIFNDNGHTHNGSKGNPLKIEFLSSAYGYNKGNDLDNIIYHEFEIQNRSTNVYRNFKFTLFSDADLGYAFDDYIAFDSTHRMGVVYNASKIDGISSNASSYGNQIPLSGYIFIEIPGDNYPNQILDMGSFNYYHNTNNGNRRQPQNVADIHNYTNGLDADANIPYYGRYAFPLSNGPVMCDSGYAGGDVRFIITTKDYNLKPTFSSKLGFAVIATPPGDNGCGGNPAWQALNKLADTAWHYYYNPIPPSLNISSSVKKATLNIYPNPAQSTVTLSIPISTKINRSDLTIIDMMGKVIDVPTKISNQDVELDLNNLANGLYFVQYNNGEKNFSGKVIKE